MPKDGMTLATVQGHKQNCEAAVRAAIEEFMKKTDLPVADLMVTMQPVRAIGELSPSAIVDRVSLVVVL